MNITFALPPNAILTTKTSSFLSSSPSSSSNAIPLPSPTSRPSSICTLVSSIATPSPSPSPSTSSFSSTHSGLKKTFDYVIVGGGAAGCVLANRLSEDASVSVALIEAGGNGDSFRISVPLGFPYLPGSDIDWKYLSEPEKELHDRKVYFPRGCMLGGSHAMSVMLYHRGDASDYQKWSDSGADGWGPDDVLKYFRKSAHQSRRLNDESASKKYHSKGGPLSVSDLRCVNPLSKLFLESCHELGIPANSDFNNWDRSQEGVGLFQVTQRDGMRESPNSAYLSPIRNRRNLTVFTDSLVEKVLIDEQSKCAVGVSMLNSEQRRVVLNANREIILSAGSCATPQLLMLSGIGPRNELEKAGVKTIVDSPGVGLNLQDHPAAVLSYQTPSPYEDKKNSLLYYTERTGKSIPTLLKYLFMGNGPLTSPMCEAGGFIRSRKELESCDIQLRFVPFASEPDPYHSLGDFATGGSYIENKSNRPAGFTLQAVLARPESRGAIKLRSGDCRDRPIIEAGWLERERDVESLVYGLRMCRSIATRGPLKKHVGTELYPGLEAGVEPGSKQETEMLEAYVRDSCHTANALVGSCRMGADGDALAPVDSKLRVKGVSNLRVIDSSVMPILPGGQTGAPTMMIAEKGADLIKECYVN